MELIDKILSEQNFKAAIKSVKQNKGASGVDKMTVDDLEEYFSENGARIKASIKLKKYKPQPVRRADVLVRKRAVATPLAITFTKLNQIIRGWINYYRIGNMKEFIDKFGQWLRHKARVVIVKQWKKPITIYRNLMKLNKMFRNNFTDEDVYKVANSRHGWYRRCGMSVVNFLLSPKVLAKENKSRPGLVDPMSYYLNKL